MKLLEIILTLFLLGTLFNNDYTRMFYICSRNVEHCHSLPIISMEKVQLKLLDKKYTNTIWNKLVTEPYRKDCISHKTYAMESYLLQRGKKKKESNGMVRNKINKMCGKNERTRIVWKGLDCFSKERKI